MKTLISQIEYHRNGSRSNGFYFVEAWQGGSPFWVTFETQDTGKEEIIVDSCRVLSPNKPYRKWQGDYFASETGKRLEYLLKKFKQPSYYDLIGRKLDRPRGFYEVCAEALEN